MERDPQDKWRELRTERDQRGERPCTRCAALLGFSGAAHAAGLTPAGQWTMGLIGTLLLFATGLAKPAVAGGSPIVFIGLGGFALGIVWLATTGVRLLRSPR